MGFARLCRGLFVNRRSHGLHPGLAYHRGLTEPGPEKRIPEPHGDPVIELGELVVYAMIGLEATGPTRADVPMVMAMVHQGIPNETDQPTRHHAGEARDAPAQGHAIP